MIRILERAAAESGDRIAVVTSETTVSYAELLRAARRVGAGLRGRGIERFAIVETDATWLISLLGGAAAVGAEACQYPPDIAGKEFAEQAVALGHQVVVTRRQDLVGDFTTIAPAELTLDEPADLGAVEEQPLIIRTTGTTGQPKAARHDWTLLGRTVASVQRRPDQRWLLAYGPHQFAGIQVIQHVLASQATLIAPFPRQPRDGLEALGPHSVTCVSATPTYWRFLLAEAHSRGVELPPLQQITLGGEAIPADLLGELERAFPGARISQVYASTEFGSVASVGDGRPGLSVDSLFSEANPSSRLKVVDGELWVRSRAGMIGYAGEAAGTTTPAEEWRATGDLVEIVGDRVLFRGRESEVINVGGVKVHPLPIEERILELDEVAMVRVFGRANKLTGAIVAVDVVPRTDLDQDGGDALRRRIKEAVADLAPAWRPRSINFVQSIQTHGNKTVRKAEE